MSKRKARRRDPDAEAAAEFGQRIHELNERWIADLESTLTPTQRQVYRHIREGLEDIAAGRVRVVTSVSDLFDAP